MLNWIILVFLLPTSVRALGHPKYECGEHGRFEYCIDGVPGCIVGCHCHPGYYFDTENKICEPNAKLVQDYRRLYSGEPTRIPLEAYSIDTENYLRSTTTQFPIEPQIDNIAKDADDLGDWLYNQFFKTIESQVKNKTETEKPPTRRSESGPGNFSESIKNKLKKKKSGRRKEGKSRKKNRALGRKDKKKKEDLRRKLLRISEDDSLFDSSESQGVSTDSSSESDSSDTSDSEGTSNERSREKDKDEDGKHNHDKDREHGHRKILMINKKPKPPLPSFIFLPQFETPFYPPIGLPPPIMPMYPMVPVPPMPPFPYPGPHPDDCNSSTTPGDQKREATTKNDNTDTTDNPNNKPTNDITTTEIHDATRDDSTIATIDENTTIKYKTDATETPSLRLAKTPIADGKMKKKLKHKKKPITPNVPDPFLDMYSPQDFLMKDFDKDNVVTKTKQSEDGSSPSGGDVDFKYLAQLIHKMEANDTKNNGDPKMDMLTPFRRTSNQLQGSASYRPIKTDEDIPMRRNFDTHDRNLESHDDLYYTKLGQQIASLIRNIDGTNGRRSEQISNTIANLGVDLPKRGPNLSNQDLNQGYNLLFQDTESAQSSNPYLYNIKKSAALSSQPISYENYGPRSYWERSVRSLFNHFHHYPETLDPKIDNLYKLENRLIIVASTERPLSLTELENILTVMAKAKKQLQRHTNDMLPGETGNENLNVNLLPQHLEVKTPAQNDYTFDRSIETDTPINSKEIEINCDEMVLDEDEVRNLNFAYNKKNISRTPTQIPLSLSYVTPNKIKLAKIIMPHNKIQLQNVSKINKEKQIETLNVSVNKKPQINLSVSNLAINTNKTNMKILNTEIMNFDSMAPSKKELTIFNFIPNLKETVNVPPYEKNNLIANASKDKQQLEARSIINNVRRNLQGVLLHNFKNVPTLLRNIPKVEARKFVNNSHINFQDIIKLQRLTTNKLKEITNAHNHFTTWLTPKVPQLINPDRPLLQPSNIKQAYRKTNIFPINRPVFIEKPVRFQLPVKTQVFSRPQSFLKQDVKAGSYFSHRVNIFE